MFESWRTFTAVLVEHPLGWIVLGIGGLALVQTALGLGRSRQWPLLPLVLGLTVLAGFLVNPLADASTSQQLRSALSRQDVLTSLAIAQMVLAAAAIACSLRCSAAQGGTWWTFGLGLVHSLPAPALIVAMLFLEHAWLERFVGARPEVVGRNVGVGAALLLALLAFAALAVPVRKLAIAHCLVSGMVVLACMFIPLLPLPLPGMQFAVQPLDHASRLTWIAVAALGGGFFLWGYLHAAGPKRNAVGSRLRVKSSRTGDVPSPNGSRPPVSLPLANTS